MLKDTGVGMRALTKEEVLELRLSKIEKKVDKIIEYTWDKKTRERLFDEEY